MKPSLGRVVFYLTPNGPLAAIITSVDGNEVSLHVWPPGGPAFDVEAVKEGQEPGCWCWPPRV